MVIGTLFLSSTGHWPLATGHWSLKTSYPCMCKSHTIGSATPKGTIAERCAGPRRRVRPRIRFTELIGKNITCLPK